MSHVHMSYWMYTCIHITYFPDPDPIILNAYHDRNMRLRWRECGLSHVDAVEENNKHDKTAWDDDEATDTNTATTSRDNLLQRLMPWLQ